MNFSATCQVYIFTEISHVCNLLFTTFAKLSHKVDIKAQSAGGVFLLNIKHVNSQQTNTVPLGRYVRKYKV